jgi:hypothetical protein
VHIFDRRVNLDAHPADASMYSLLRSWAQDDPYRKIQVPLTMTTKSASVPVTPDNGDSSTGKRPADAMLLMLPPTTMDTSTRPPPKTRNVRQDIGSLDDNDGKDHNDNNHGTDMSPLQQLVSKANRVKRRKLSVHKARMATALVSLERRGIHLSTADNRNSSSNDSKYYY